MILGRSTGKEADGEACNRARQHAMNESLRWGEPTVVPYMHDRLMWAVPLMHNARVLGGLVASTSEDRVFADGADKPAIDIRAACEDLRRLAAQEDLTNVALLDARREEYRRERSRAEAIHDVKAQYYYSIREVYLREEPSLISAMRKGQRPEARAILNRLLVAIYHLGGEKMDLIKSFVMELVVTMCRTAVESGGNPEELLGANYASIGELAGIDSEERLSRWLVHMLERIMDSVRGQREPSSETLVHGAMRYLGEHFSEPISRDDVADVACLSPSYFSRLFNKATGRTLPDMRNQQRVDRAAELLRRTDKSMLQIASETGFVDQSYFTKVFRRYMGKTPRQYRQGR